MYNISPFINITRDEREAYQWHRDNYSDKNTSRYSIFVRFERNTDGGDLHMFSNMSNNGILPILCSFPTFISAYNFVCSFRPGFIYSEEFQILLHKFLIRKKYKGKYSRDKTYIYKLDHNRFTIVKSHKYNDDPFYLEFGEDIITMYMRKYRGKYINSDTIAAIVKIGSNFKEYCYCCNDNKIKKVVKYYDVTNI